MVLELKYILIYNLFNFLKTEVYFYIYYETFYQNIVFSKQYIFIQTYSIYSFNFLCIIILYHLISYK
ncbi:hypothetical protein HanRHA438_Chr05g0211071 [Helianthus annuus]|nr:hypothetical protein HanRHA438_Chr05g0211071 [Helianthus annuus]